MRAMTGREYKEQMLVETVPDEAWNAVLRGASTMAVIGILRSLSPMFHGMIQARDTVIAMREVLGMRAL